MDWTGLISIFGGIYGYLMAIGYLPKNPRDPQKMKLWRDKFGGVMKVLCPLIVVFGFIELSGVLQRQ